MSLCFVEPDHLCNFSRRHYRERSCESILNLDQWFRCCLKKKFMEDDRSHKLTLSLRHILLLVTDNNPSRISWREENYRRNYFMINLHESKGWAGIEFATPGSAVRHLTDCTTGPSVCVCCKGYCMNVQAGPSLYWMPACLISTKIS